MEISTFLLMKLSLRTKLTMALIFTSVTAVLIVGFYAHRNISVNFTKMASDRIFLRFQEDALAYYKKYGSWEAARMAEPFPIFVSRKRRVPPPPLHKGFGRPPHPPYPHFPPPSPDRRHMPPPNHVRRPPPRLHPPQVIFALFDPEEIVQIGAGKFTPGTKAPEHFIGKSRPVNLAGELIGWAYPIAPPELTAAETAYFSSIENALLYALLAAFIISLVLGGYFGHRLSASLRELTRAIRSMSRGELKQQVRIRAMDEAGALAQAFNHMSEELSRAHTELAASHNKITRQAYLLKELAIRDELTRLYNRRHFNEQATVLFNQAQRYKHPFSLMIGDIDYFKRVNDNFSHAIGDEVLKAVGAIFRKYTRQSDIVARYGGEEFVIIFAETPLDMASALCEGLRMRIESYPWSVIDSGLKITMSMGLSSNDEHNQLEAVLSEADRMLYQAKEAGRNRVCS